MRALIRKKWDPERTWEDPDEAGNTEPQNSDQSALPAEEACHLSRLATLPEETNGLR